MNFTQILSAAAAAVLTAGVCASASAAGHRSSPAPARMHRPPPPGLADTVIQFGTGGTTLTAGSFNTIDTPSTLDCNKPNGCVILITDMVQLQTPDGLWAICPEVDGTLTNPGCPYQGSIPAGGSTYVTGNALGNFTVSPGTHTVQTTVYVDQTSLLANWQTSYLEYRVK